ncbi:hypothetical protein [Methylomonas koyamae]|uniref:hypothetical protein n=1 Tax=Methylomonas koyamae TaxID=702114 RepID=UPI0006D2B2ED|nr:hypothetical protein [Methylomonas koyamae]
MTDLSVKVVGGYATIKRRYYDDAWHWEHERTRLKLTRDLYSGLVVAIDRGGVAYKPAAFGSEHVFLNGAYRIVKTQTGFTWEDANGNWQQYDANGRVLAHGSKGSQLWQLVYTDSETLHPAAIADRNGNPVLWLAYDATAIC